MIAVHPVVPKQRCLLQQRHQRHQRHLHHAMSFEAFRPLLACATQPMLRNDKYHTSRGDPWHGHTYSHASPS